jgi:hypothetical protein
MFDPYEYSEDELRVVREIYGSGNGGINESDFAVQIMDSEKSARNLEFKTFVQFKCGEENLRQMVLSTKEDCGNETDTFISRSKTNPNEYTITRNWLAPSYEVGYEKRSFAKCVSEPSGGGLLLKFDAELGVSNVSIFILPKKAQNRDARFTLDGKPFVGTEFDSVDLFWQNKFLTTIDTKDLSEKQAVASAIFFVCDMLCKLSICRIFRAIVVSYAFFNLSRPLSIDAAPTQLLISFLSSNEMNEYMEISDTLSGSYAKRIRDYTIFANPLGLENLDVPYRRLELNKKVERSSYTRAKAALDGLNKELEKLSQAAANLVVDDKLIVKSAQDITKTFREQIRVLISLQTTISADVLQSVYTQFRRVFDIAMIRMSDIVTELMQRKTNNAFDVAQGQENTIRNSYRFLDRLLSSQNSLQRVTILYLLSNAASPSPKNVFPNDNPNKFNSYLREISDDLFKGRSKKTSTLQEASDFIFEALTEKTLNQKTLQGEQDATSLENQIFEFFKDKEFLTEVNLGIAALSKQAQSAVDILHRTLEKYNANNDDEFDPTTLITQTRPSVDGDGFFFDFQITTAADELESKRLSLQEKVERGGDPESVGITQKNVTLLSLAILILNQLRRFYREKTEIDFAQISIPADVLSDVILQSTNIENVLFLSKANAAIEILKKVEEYLKNAGQLPTNNVTTLIALLKDPSSLRRIPNSDNFVVETLEKIRSLLGKKITTELVEQFNVDEVEKVFDFNPLGKATLLLYCVVYIAKTQFVYVERAEQRAEIIERVKATENIYTEYLAKCIEIGNPYDWQNLQLGDVAREIADYKLKEFLAFLKRVLSEQGKIAFRLPVPSEWDNMLTQKNEVQLTPRYNTLVEIRELQDQYWDTLYERSKISDSLYINDDPIFKSDYAEEIKNALLSLIEAEIVERVDRDGINLAQKLQFISMFGRVTPFTKAAADYLSLKLEEAFVLFPRDTDVSAADKRTYYANLQQIEKTLIKYYNISFGTSIAVPARVSQIENPSSLLEKLRDISSVFGVKTRPADMDDDDADVDDKEMESVVDEKESIEEDTDIFPPEYNNRFANIPSASAFRTALDGVQNEGSLKAWISQLEDISVSALAFVATAKQLLGSIVEHDKLPIGTQDRLKKIIGEQLEQLEVENTRFRAATARDPFDKWAIRRTLMEFYGDVFPEAALRLPKGVEGEKTKERIAKEKELGRQLIEEKKAQLAKEKEIAKKKADEQKAENADMKILLADLKKIKGELKNQAAEVKTQVDIIKKSVDVVETALRKTEIGEDDVGKFQNQVEKLQAELTTYKKKIDTVFRQVTKVQEEAVAERNQKGTEFAAKQKEIREIITGFGNDRTAAKATLDALILEVQTNADNLRKTIDDRANQEILRKAENSLQDGKKELKRLQNLNDKLEPLVDDVERENTKAVDLQRRSSMQVVATDAQFLQAQQRLAVLQSRVQTTISQLTSFQQQVQNIQLMAPGIDQQFAVLLNIVTNAFASFVRNAQALTSGETMNDEIRGQGTTRIVQGDTRARKKPATQPAPSQVLSTQAAPSQNLDDDDDDEFALSPPAPPKPYTQPPQKIFQFDPAPLQPQTQPKVFQGDGTEGKKPATAVRRTTRFDREPDRAPEKSSSKQGKLTEESTVREILVPQTPSDNSGVPPGGKRLVEFVQSVYTPEEN